MPTKRVPSTQTVTSTPAIKPVDENPSDEGYYFTSNNKALSFIPTGSTLLDLVLGGGWPLGRMSNIIGDFSSGKSLLCIEACINCKTVYPDSKIYYFEAESAFDKDYAQALGLPVDDIIFPAEDFPEITIEALFNHLELLIDEAIKEKSTTPILYILDSLDALSDEAEIKRKIDEGSYNMTKQKKLSEIFRRLSTKITRCNLHLLIVSQIRMNIGGITYGAKYTRSGGKAMDFYASHCLWLDMVNKINKQVGGLQRVSGVNIKAVCKKNKVGIPFRECTFPIMFGYGIDDLVSCLSFIETVKGKEAFPVISKLILNKEYKTLQSINDSVNALPEDRYLEAIKTLTQYVSDLWFDIEKGFLPVRRKY